MNYNQKLKKILDRIQSTYSKVNPVQSCADYGCKAILNTRAKLIFKGENFPFNSTDNNSICDCIIFKDGNPITVYLIELKNSTNIKTAQIEKKFDNALKILCDTLDYNDQKNINIKIILLSRGYNHSEIAVLGRTRFVFHGHKNKIQLELKKCGCVLQ